jgi:branched-subunit amino acid transport protein AzlD
VPDPLYIASAVPLSAAITWTLRGAPFAILARMRHSLYLSLHMPLGVMLILAAYTLRDMPTNTPLLALPFTTAVAATIGLHLWRRNALLSIAAGTATHVTLTTLLA